jgi:hypothetical protein
MYSYQSESLSGGIIFLLICAGILSIIVLICFFIACSSVKKTKMITEKLFLVSLSGLTQKQLKTYKAAQDRYNYLYANINFSKTEFWDEIFAVLEKSDYNIGNESNTDVDSSTT